MHSTSFPDLVGVASAYFYPALLATEDMDAFLAAVRSGMREAAAAAVAECLERFDREVASQVPRSWELRGRPARTVVTMVGAVTYRRGRYRDDLGRPRYPADELLGVPRRARLTADAFLWIVGRAARVSFRRAAADFAEVSGAEVSAMTAWRAVQREAELIRADLALSPSDGVSQADVFAEADGLYVALQAPERRREAISRFFYEQARAKKSLELKVGCVYAGKREVRPGRAERGNVALFATSGPASELREGMEATVRSCYDASDIERVHYASDGAGWCADGGLGDVGGELVRGLDLFHVMRCVHRAFPEGAGREHAVSLALRRRPEALAEAVGRMMPQVADPSRLERMGELKGYVERHADLLRGGGSLGTMEATNAYVWAKRMKSFGCSWGRRGAGNMALVLARVHGNRPLVAPPKGALFTGADDRRRDAALAARGALAARQTTAGSGWEPKTATFPHARSAGAWLPGSFLDQRPR